MYLLEINGADPDVRRSYPDERGSLEGTGSIGINRYIPDPAAPFGGVKDSGLGRELGPEGLASYQVLKSIYV